MGACLTWFAIKGREPDIARARPSGLSHKAWSDGGSQTQESQRGQLSKLTGPSRVLTGHLTGCDSKSLGKTEFLTGSRV